MDFNRTKMSVNAYAYIEINKIHGLLHMFSAKITHTHTYINISLIISLLSSHLCVDANYTCIHTSHMNISVITSLQALHFCVSANYIYTHICIHTYIHTHKYTYKHISHYQLAIPSFSRAIYSGSGRRVPYPLWPRRTDSASVCVCMYVCVYVCMHPSVPSLTEADRLGICMYVCMYVLFIYAFMYAHIRMWDSNAYIYVHMCIHLRMFSCISSCTHTYICVNHFVYDVISFGLVYIHTWMPLENTPHIHAFMYVCMHVCMYVCMYTHTISEAEACLRKTHAHTWIYMYVCKYVHVHIHMYVYTYIHVQYHLSELKHVFVNHLHKFIRVLCMYVCMYVCMRVCILCNHNNK